MEVQIRKNVEEYMQELKRWILETADTDLEEMDGFFTARVGEYEAHMAVWEEAYCRIAGLLPQGCKNILDLGCGTGLELDKIWEKYPEIAVTGVDLCQSMLNILKEKHQDKKLETVCADYFCYNMGECKWDAAVSFESFHHFLPERKKALYHKIFQALKEGAVFILGDYIACCKEEEALLRKVYFEKRRSAGIPEEVFVHFDIPLTLGHEIELLQEAGFLQVEVVDCIEGATILLAKK